MSAADLTRWGRAVARFTTAALVPALVLVLLALVTGVVRTAALVVFAVIVGLKAVMTGLDRLEMAAPTPRYLVRMEASA